MGKMSSQYPVLDNRPIDQWKVTELKEELKRRKLITKGLKDDLIRRLDDALRMERDTAEEETTVEKENGTTNEEFGQEIHAEPENVETKPAETHLVEDSWDTEHKTLKVDETATTAGIEGELDGKAKLVGTEQVQDTKHVDKARQVDDSAIEVDNDDKQEHEGKKLVESQMVDDAGDDDKEKTHKVDGTATDDINASSANSDEKVQDGKFRDDNDSVQMDEEPVVPAVSVETSVTVVQTVVTQITSSEGKFGIRENQAKNEAPNHPHTDDVFDSNNQVPEASSVLGLKVNESVSSDSLSINETNKLKDSLNVNNFHELEVVKPEIVEPSSSDLHPEGGDVPELAEHMQVDNQTSVEEIDDTTATNIDMSKQMDTVDAGSSKKLNLDQSPGDDIMEEDVLKSKQMDLSKNSDDVNNRNDTHSQILKEESGFDTSAHPVSSDKEISAENGNNHAGPAEKRKFEGQVVENNEPPKRQRKFNYGTPKVFEPPNSTLTPTTPKDMFQSTIPKCNFSRSDSTVGSGEETPKERAVPPSSRPPTNSLRIDRFLRPFTLKAVKELLGKTGTVSSFWMDQIKTHCYVTYSSVGEAEETRNAVYNLQWPANGGHLLVAEFVDPQEVKVRVEPPVEPAVLPANRSPTTAAAPTPFLSKPLPHQHILKEHLPLPSSPLARERAELPPPPPVLLSNPPSSRESVQLPPPPPPLPTKADIPVLTLDDLFKKTKSTPRIYYLPLSDEQVAAKIAAGNRSSK